MLKKKVMKLEELIYIQETIDWINNKSQLIDMSNVNKETLCNRVTNSQTLLDRAIAEAKKRTF